VVRLVREEPPQHERRRPRVRIEQVGEVYDLPLTLTVQYVDGRSEDITLKLTDRLVEETLTGRIRRVTVRDSLSVYEIVR
jgi:hypothetical protein